jgi:hydrogenase expression/formation protein HypE
MSLRAGKLPAAMLAQLLGRVQHRDPRVLLGPGIGRDAAVIDLGGDRLLVAKTDPVTFAADQIGRYAVHVNANDIACMGARPAWMLATALLPPGAPDGLPGQIFDQLIATCESLGIELVGGHTEVTSDINRPIVIGAMLGEATRDEIVLGGDVVPGDSIILTKGIAIEGTALLAREFGSALQRRGLDRATIARAAALLHDPGISVVTDARAVCDATRPRALHDPTEGGLVTALEELAVASNCTIRVDLSRVPILEETRSVCETFDLDPFGVLASGALLAIVAAGDCEVAIASLRSAKIECRVIGGVEAGPATAIMGDQDADTPLPHFDRDEIARFIEAAQAPGHVDIDHLEGS